MKEKEKEPAEPKEVLDPNDPSSYHLPPELQSEEFAFRGGGGGSMRKGRAGGEEVLPPGDEETVLTEKMAGEERRRAELEGDEEERAPASRLPQMKPMPSTSGEKDYLTSTSYNTWVLTVREDALSDCQRIRK